MKKIMLLAISTTLIACNKEKPKQYSHWTINGQEYSSNNVEVAEGHNRPLSILGNYDSIRFDLQFIQGYLPTEGSWPLATESTVNQPSKATLAFYLGTKPYIASKHNTNHLKASAYNGKARYTLEPTWFTYHYDPTDSVLITGTFNAP